MKKTTYPIAIVFACVIAACGEKTPPTPSVPKPKVEAVKPVDIPRPPEAPMPAPASAGQDAGKK